LLKPAAGLLRVNLSSTDVSPARIELWQAEVPHWPPVIEFESPWIHLGLLMTVRWSDGTRSSGFRGGYVCKLYESVDQPLPSYELAGHTLTRPIFGLKALQAEPRRGVDYWATLRLGDYESEPATCNISGATRSPAIIEFRMPCTKAQALRSAKAVKAS
jgi:hypothetical protein